MEGRPQKWSKPGGLLKERMHRGGGTESRAFNHDGRMACPSFDGTPVSRSELPGHLQERLPA